MRVLIILSALLVDQGLAPSANAGAWTRAPGSTFTSQSVKFFTTEFTSDTSPSFRKVATSSYLEYGLTDAVTLGGELDYALRADGAEEGLIRAFARARVWRGEAGDVVSAEISGGYPALNALSPVAAARDVTPDAKLGVAYGRGLPWGAGGWAEASLAFRHRMDSPADEIKLDLTLGWRPNEDFLLIGQIFGTLGLRNEGPFGANYDALKLSLSAGYVLSERRTLLLAIAQDAFGRNIDLGTEIGVTIWTEF